MGWLSELWEGANWIGKHIRPNVTFTASERLKEDRLYIVNERSLLELAVYDNLRPLPQPRENDYLLIKRIGTNKHGAPIIKIMTGSKLVGQSKSPDDELIVETNWMGKGVPKKMGLEVLPRNYEFVRSVIVQKLPNLLP